MTNEEKEMLKNEEFEDIWLKVWGRPANFSYYKNEEVISRDKFNQLKNSGLKEMVDTSTTRWEEPEWGFPKGRRNYNESDLDCSIREFNEETGLNLERDRVIHNIAPFEEIFCGSNYKSYKHRYFLTCMDYNSEELRINSNEISKIEWKPYADCILSIRPYNLEKKKMLMTIDILLGRTHLLCK